MKKIIIICFLFLSVSSIRAQELDAKITINTSKLQGVRSEIFTTLQNSLQQLLNERKWTNATFGRNEKIDCSFVITLNQATDNNYTGELQITSRRPVFNSQYSTSMFTFKDADVIFDYMEGEALEFNENAITNNLVAIISFYAYVVIGLDFDSFAMNGGKPYFAMAMSIANSAQTLGEVKGWAPFDSDYNRYSLALALTEEASSQFHNMWYTYHRLGLDEMAGNIVRGRDRIIASTKDLQTIHAARPSSPLLLFYGDTKLNELTDVYSEATKEERTEAYELLRRIFPTKSNQLSKLRRN